MQTIKIKPLNWVERDPGEVWICREWDFKITLYDDHLGAEFGLSPIDWPPFDTPYKSLEEAKKAAQDAHEKMILSAIEEEA